MLELHIDTIVECPCGFFHPYNFTGRCDDQANRYGPDPEKAAGDYSKAIGIKWAEVQTLLLNGPDAEINPRAH